MKIAYADRQAATVVLDKMMRPFRLLPGEVRKKNSHPMIVYECRHCAKFHIGYETDKPRVLDPNIGLGSLDDLIRDTLAAVAHRWYKMLLTKLPHASRARFRLCWEDVVEHKRAEKQGKSLVQAGGHRTTRELARQEYHGNATSFVPEQFLTVFGRTQSVISWAREYGVKYTSLRYRLASGWDPERALTTGLPYRRYGAPLSAAERQRRCRERKRAAAGDEHVSPPF